MTYIMKYDRVFFYCFSVLMLVLLSMNSLRSQIAWKISYIWCQHVNGLVLLPCLALISQGEPCREWLVMHGKPPLSPEVPHNSLSHPRFSSALFRVAVLHFVMLAGSPPFRARPFLPFIDACNPEHPLLSSPLHSSPLLSIPLLCCGESESQESTYREPGVFTRHKRDDINCERISVPRQG